MWTIPAYRQTVAARTGEWSTGSSTSSGEEDRESKSLEAEKRRFGPGLRPWRRRKGKEPKEDKAFQPGERTWTLRMKRISLEEQKAQKEDRFLRGRQVAFMIYDNFRATGAHDSVLDWADLFSVTLRDDNVQEFDTRWDEVLLFYVKNSIR